MNILLGVTIGLVIMLIAGWGIASDGNGITAMVALVVFVGSLFGWHYLRGARATKRKALVARATTHLRHELRDEAAAVLIDNRHTVTPPPPRAPLPPPPPPAEWVTKYLRPQPPVKQFADRLQTLWYGGSVSAKFTYRNAQGRSTRRTVDVTRISHNPDTGRLYLHGFCYVRMEERTFNVDNIRTKILVGGKRWDPFAWIEHIVGIDLSA